MLKHSLINNLIVGYGWRKDSRQQHSELHFGSIGEMKKQQNVKNMAQVVYRFLGIRFKSTSEQVGGKHSRVCGV